MKTIEESVVIAMDGSNQELFPVLCTALTPQKPPLIISQLMIISLKYG